MHFLELDDVLEIHANQIADYGGSDGLRDLGLLESAISQPQVSNVLGRCQRLAPWQSRPTMFARFQKKTQLESSCVR